MAELRSKGVLKLVCFDFCNVFILIFHIPCLSHNSKYIFVWLFLLIFGKNPQKVSNLWNWGGWVGGSTNLRLFPNFPVFYGFPCGQPPGDRMDATRRFWIWKIFVWLWSFFYVFSTVCFHVAELMSPAGKMVSRENGPSFTRQATWALLLNWIMFIVIYLLSRIMWIWAIIYINCPTRNLSSTAKLNGILPTILKIKTQNRNKI